MSKLLLKNPVKFNSKLLLKLDCMDDYDYDDIRVMAFKI
jgi:hypothetical protein